jgi:hypothetical protein
MERNVENMKNEKKYMGNKRNYLKFGENKKGKGKKWKKGIKKMERKIKGNGKENGNECERGKEKGKMVKCGKW